MRKVTRTQFEEDDDDMVSEITVKHIYLYKGLSGIIFNNAIDYWRVKYSSFICSLQWILIWSSYWMLNLSFCLSRWLTAHVETVSTISGAGQWSVDPVDSRQTNPPTALWAQPPAPSAAEASPRVCCHTRTCSAPAPLARWAPPHKHLMCDIF